jgi:hypothetical protein
VSGDQQRHELVAEFPIRERVAVLVSGLQEQRQDVGPVAEVGGLAATGDLGEQLGVDLGELAPEAAEAHQPIGAEEAEHEAAARVGRPRHQAPQAGGEPLECRPLLNAEDRAQNDPERDGVHPRQRGHRHAGRPGRDLPAGRFADEVFVGAHALPVERRQDELAAAQMLATVEQEEVLCAQQRTQ